MPKRDVHGWCLAVKTRLLHRRIVVLWFVLIALGVSSCDPNSQYQKGYQAGLQSGTQSGTDNGFKDGYGKGYDTGFQAGAGITGGSSSKGVELAARIALGLAAVKALLLCLITGYTLLTRVREERVVVGKLFIVGAITLTLLAFRNYSFLGGLPSGVFVATSAVVEPSLFGLVKIAGGVFLTMAALFLFDMIFLWKETIFKDCLGLAIINVSLFLLAKAALIAISLPNVGAYAVSDVAYSFVIGGFLYFGLDMISRHSPSS